jgi:hypothetical protein
VAAAPAFETITVSTTAIGITAGIIDGHNHAVITSENADYRYRVDGTDPTASVGHLITAGTPLILEGSREVNNFRAIRDAAADVTLSVTIDTRSRLGN